MVKKVLFLFLAVFLVTSLFTGCGSPDGTAQTSTQTTAAVTTQSAASTEKPTQDDTQKYGDTGGLKLPLVDKPTKITWVIGYDSTTNLNESDIIKEIEARTGVRVDVQPYPVASFADKVKVIVASGNLPDVFNGLKPAEVMTLGGQGALVAFNKYADILPNFKKLYMEENAWVMKSYSDDQGNIYTWPLYGVNREVNHGFLYRKDIFDKNSITEWNTTEEFYQALKKLKEIYPNSYPYASKTKETIFKDWAFGWGISNVELFPAYYDESSKLWKAAVIQPEYKDMLDFMKKLCNEGLLDPEFLTDTPAAWTGKMTQNDKAFVTFDWIGRLDMFYDQVKDQNPDYNLRYANPIGSTGKIRALPKIADWGICVANNNNKEAAIKLMDYLTSPSGATLMTVGIENKHWVLDSSGKVSYPGLTDVPKVDISTLTERYGCWIQGMYLNADRRSVYFNYTEKEQEAQDKMVNNNKIDAADPVLKYNDAETAVMTEIQSALLKATYEFSSKYVLDISYGDKEWEQWLVNAEKLGVKKLEDAHNSAQKRYDAIK